MEAGHNQSVVFFERYTDPEQRCFSSHIETQSLEIWFHSNERIGTSLLPFQQIQEKQVFDYVVK
jgi:hypothetical protein